MKENINIRKKDHKENINISENERQCLKSLIFILRRA